MKILVSRGLYGEHLGGAEVEVVDFIKLLAADEHNILLVSNSSEIADKIKDYTSYKRLGWPRSDIRLLRVIFTPLRLLWFSARLIFLTRQFKPDLIIAESKEDGIVLALTKRLHKAPVLWRDHADLRHHLKNSRTNSLARVYQSMLVRALNKVDAIVTVSRYDKDHISKFVSKLERVHIIHPGTIIDKAKLKKLKPSKIVNIGTIARLVEDKGIQYLIQAASTIPSSDYRLVIVGDGEYREELENLTTKLGVEALFAGHTSQPDKYYESFDIFIQPSKYEGWSKTVVEAMLHRLPVVASDIPSHNEQIEDGVTGFLFKNEDASSLASRLQKLLHDAPSRITMGKEAQKSARKFGNLKYIFKNQWKPLLNKLGKSLV